MKNNALRLFLTVVLVMLVTSFVSSQGSGQEQGIRRGSKAITFILGEDVDAGNPYYRMAELYYRIDEKNKTEVVVTSCHSLVEVQEYLIQHAPGDLQPWELINLVSHGNHYLGLSVKIVSDGKRASVDGIEKHIADGAFVSISENVVNNQTIIELHGCGLGNNPELVQAVKSAFSNEKNSPVVRASKYFEYYVFADNYEHAVKRYFADFWTIHYKMGYRPDNRAVEKEFAVRYPMADVNWKEALFNIQASQEGDVFHYSFEVPVKWVIRYDCVDSVPKLENEKEKLLWVMQNPRISHDLQKLNLSAENFNWWMRPIFVKNEDLTKTPALWVKGYCTMLCALRLLPAEVNIP